MKIALGIAAGLLLGLALLAGAVPTTPTTAAPVARVEPFALYDDFNGVSLNPDKWIGSEVAEHGTDARRIQVNGKLRMYYGSWADTTSDTGAVQSNLALNFINPDTVTAMKATIQVQLNHGEVGCPANVSANSITRSSARMRGAFFNNSSPVPGSLNDDVVASVRVYRLATSVDGANTFRIEGVETRCLDATCTGQQSFVTANLGFVTAPASVTASIQWDAPNNKFIFQVGANTPVDLTYTWSDAALPSTVLKRVEMANRVPNCTSATRPVTWMTAQWDDVMVNQSAATAAAIRARGRKPFIPAYEKF